MPAIFYLVKRAYNHGPFSLFSDTEYPSSGLKDSKPLKNLMPPSDLEASAGSNERTSSPWRIRSEMKGLSKKGWKKGFLRMGGEKDESEGGDGGSSGGISTEVLSEGNSGIVGPSAAVSEDVRHAYTLGEDGVWVEVEMAVVEVDRKRRESSVVPNMEGEENE